MSKKKAAPKIGAIRLTENQRAIIAQSIDSDFFLLIANVLRPKRQTQIAVTALNVSQDDKDLMFYKGKSSEADWFVKFLKDTATDYHAKQLKEDAAD